MKISQLKTIVKEAVKEAIQDELKDILLEAVRAPKQITQPINPPTTQQTSLPETDKVKLRENMMGVLDSMRPGGGGNISATTNDIPLQITNADTAGPNGQLPAGNVSMDQIMGLMNKR